MALFGKKEPVVLDARLAPYAELPPVSDREYNSDVKRLSDNADLILNAVRNEEVVLVANAGYNSILVLTKMRVLELKKRGIERNFRYAEIARTGFGSLPNGSTFVRIETHSYRMDFRPDDWERIHALIYVEVALPRIGNNICVTVDKLAGLES